MISDPITINLKPAGPTHHYQLCSRRLSINQEIKALAAYRVHGTEHQPSCDDTAIAIDTNALKTVFNGSGFLAGRDRDISCFRASDGFVIRIPDATDFYVNQTGTVISQLDEVTGRFSAGTFEFQKISVSGFEQILLGPPVMLSLALNHQFALHASSVMIHKKAVLFVGESGSGKSTLAQWLEKFTNLQRLADDISVIQSSDDDYRLCPDFPQMKLKDRQQPVNIAALPLSAVISLKRSQRNQAKLSKLNGMDAMQTLLNHSVAAQLFDKSLAHQHMQFMSDLCSKIPVYKLHYADGEANTPTIATTLTDEIN